MMNFVFPWKVGQGTGWGRYGIGLALALRRLGHGVLLNEGVADDAGAIHAARFCAEQLLTGARKVTLRPIGNTFDSRPADDQGTKVGLLVTECSELSDRQITNLKTYDVVLAGCEWGRKVLAVHEVASIAFPQGVDTLTFSPDRQRPVRREGDPFLIFSGGKIEFRKGHDLVIETFRTLRRRFPEINAKLVISWHNFWPNTIGGLHHTGHLTSLPTFTDGRWNFAEWLPTQGVSAEDVIVLDPLLSESMAQIIRDCDAGLFLSRAEGNVNMSLAECLACGVPAVVSGNTGHLEYINEPLVTLASTWPLQRRTLPDYTGLDGWGEVDPNECAAMLAMIAKERTDMKVFTGVEHIPTASAAAKDFASRWSWDTRAAALVKLLEDALG